ncbi:cytoplasmic tRNA 2-thiolation protein 2 [Topomyia yanbarensis]|uniref:cytoplasmic tRNA 2-thiolation protein 2 n=1 Tax=Topomyia yanbarensis TaxID=2498891 RepID=UPI00273BF64B|nr:cytoplasmic tRNA 2-thiolation protein 2 [Topomyia yanbarensis]
MCSIAEDDFGDEGGLHVMKEESPTPSTAGSITDECCRKCNQNQAVLKLNLKEPQCRDCFLHYVRHKFRAALGSTKIVRRGAKVLVVFNGSRENVVMLDMIRYGLQQESFKKLRIDPVVLFVSEDFLATDQKKRLKAIEDKLNVLKQFEFSSYVTVLGGLECCSLNEANLLENFVDSQEKLETILKGIKSTTSKQDFIVQIRRQTYKTFAKKLECGYIFLSAIGLDLAKTLLSNVALGRGRSLASDIAFCDDRDEERKIIRPMRDLNPDEIDNYLTFSENQLNYVVLEDPFKNSPSLQNLTSQFVDGLQKTFPSTVSTVFRTGDKLCTQIAPATVGQTGDDEDLLNLFEKSLQLNVSNSLPTRCKFCHSALDFQGSSALFATEFSRMVSSRINVELSHEEIVESTRQMEQDAAKAVNGEVEGDGQEMESLRKELCHSCRNIFLDFSSE